MVTLLVAVLVVVHLLFNLGNLVVVVVVVAAVAVCCCLLLFVSLLLLLVVVGCWYNCASTLQQLFDLGNLVSVDVVANTTKTKPNTQPKRHRNKQFLTESRIS